MNEMSCIHEIQKIKEIHCILFRSSASASAKQTLFYVEVTDDMHIHPGKFEL